MPSYILHWRGGDTQVVHGRDAADAMTQAGLGHGALQALDYWEKILMDDPDEIERLERERGE